MFRISTNEPRTDLGQVGQRSDQLINYAPLRQAQHDIFQAQQRNRMFQQQKALKDQHDIQSEIAKIGTAKVKPADLPAVIENNNKIYEKATKFMDVNGSLTNKNRQELMSDITQAHQFAVNSAAHREELLKRTDAYNSNPGKYTKESYDKVLEAWKKPGEHHVIPELEPKVDITKYVKDELQPHAHQLSQIARRNITEKEAKESLTNVFKANETFANSVRDEAQLAYPDKKITDEDAIKFLHDTQVPQLLYQFKEPPSQVAAAAGIGQKQEEGKINATYDPNTRQLVAYRGSKTDKPVAKDVSINGQSVRIAAPVVRFDKDHKNIIGGSITVTPTPTQEQDNKKAREFNINQDKKIEDNLTKRKLYPDKSDKKEYAKWEKAKLELEAQYPKTPIPHPEQKVDISDPSMIEGIFEQYWGKKPQDIQTGKDRSNVNYNEVESKPHETQTKKIGGHEYTFDELKQMGKKAGKSDKEIQDYWNNLK